MKHRRQPWSFGSERKVFIFPLLGYFWFLLSLVVFLVAAMAFESTEWRFGSVYSHGLSYI